MNPQQRPPDRHDDRLARRRAEILAAAAAVFDANGYAATTMAAVAARAGVAKGSLYNYFPSKHDLFTQVFTASVAEDEEGVDALLASPVSVAEKLDNYIDYWFHGLARYKRIGGLILEFWANIARDRRKGELAGLFQEMYRRWRDQLAGIVRQGVDSGELRADLDSDAAARLIMSVMDGLTIHVILDISPTIDEALLAALKRGLLGSLRAPADGGHPESRSQA